MSLDLLAAQPEEVPTTTSSSTGLMLEQLSVAILNLVNTRNFDDPVLTHVSPTYRSNYDTTVLTNTKEQFVERIRDLVQRFPEYHMAFSSTSSAVDEDKGKASVWVTHSAVGFPADGLERESVKMMTWERNKGRWLCMGHTGLRASGFI